MTARPLERGANVSLTKERPSLTGVVIGVRWGAGADSRLAADVVAATLLCGADHRVLSDRHVVFFNQLVSPDTSVAQLEELLGDDDEQIEIDLDAVPPEIERISVFVYLHGGGAGGRSLGQLRSCTIRVLDLHDSTELVRSEDLAAALSGETALVLGQLYRRDGGWKFRVVGQGYSTGLAGVADDYGIPL